MWPVKLAAWLLASRCTGLQAAAATSVLCDCCCCLPSQCPGGAPCLQVICTKVRDGDKRIVRLKEGTARDRHVVIVDDLVQSGEDVLGQPLLSGLGARSERSRLRAASAEGCRQPPLHGR